MTPAILLALGLVLLMPVQSRTRVIKWEVPRLRLQFGHGERAEDVLVEVLVAMRDELIAGAALRAAFERAVAATDSSGVLAGPAATSRMGGDVPDSLRAATELGPLAASLAALWQVGEGSGAAMAGALDRLIEGARVSSAVRLEAAAQLSGPKATVRVLALLPLIGLGMGVLMGADPLGFLLGSIWGWLVLLLAGLLEVAGVWWMRTLVAGIERQM